MAEEITYELIDNLYKIKKVTTDVLQWNDDTDSESNVIRRIFSVDLIAENGTELNWFGYYQNKRGISKHGFTLKYKRKYIVRSWDMGSQHKSHLEQRYIRGVGRHKHFFLNSMHEREAYEIPEGEISILDPNEAVHNFADECSIQIKFGYQSEIFI